MKKKPASKPEALKSVAKPERSRTERATPSAVAEESEVEKSVSSRRKPLLDIAMDTVKKVLKPKKSPAKTTATAKAAEPKPSAPRKNGVEEPKVEVDAT